MSASSEPDELERMPSARPSVEGVREAGLREAGAREMGSRELGAEEASGSFAAGAEPGFEDRAAFDGGFEGGFDTGGDPDAFDPRARAAFRTWISALATDAEAAMAAALAYESMDTAARDAWLDVLLEDAPGLPVPKIAIYAPLLSVETDPGRRRRMAEAMAPARLVSASRDDVASLRGVSPEGVHVAVILSPVYLEFVEVLVCRYSSEGFISVSHDPLRHVDEAMAAFSKAPFGVAVEETPVRVVVEELAHAILAERRAKRDLSPALSPFVHLFGLDFEGDGSEPVA